MMTSFQVALVFALLAFVSGVPSSFREDRATFYFTNPSQSSCSAEDGREGYCLIQGCRVNQLKYKGRCGFRLASCCVAEQSCLKSTNVNNTYFVNPGFPKATSSLGRCELTVKRRTSDICQIRLDFIEFVLEQPDENGYCLNDVFSVKGATSTVPTLCGNNTGQHLYFDVDPITNDLPIILSVNIKDITLLKRKWNVKVSQIQCSSQEKAPSGCLQYYFGPNGEVRSFNFGSETKGTRQLANTEYSACVRHEQDHCSITWKANGSEGEKVFTMSGNVTAAEEGQLHLEELFDKPCDGEKDFILIPNGVNAEGQRSERHCGLAFLGSIETSFQPYVLRTYTGPTENGDERNTGFSLVYSQNVCN